MSIIHTSTVLNSSDFVRSLTIEERYHFYKMKSQHADLPLNQQAVEEWQRRKKVISDEQFLDMLKINDYDLSIFSHAIDDNYELNKSELSDFVEEQPWFIELNRIFSNRSIEEVAYRSDFNYGYMIRPYIFEANQQLEAVFESQSELKIEPQLIEQLLEGLASKLIAIANKTLILELNISKIKNELVGSTPEERFHYFFEYKGSLTELVHFYNEYCVLARMLWNETQQFINNIRELVERLIESKAELLNWLPESKELHITSLHFGEGDTHQRGRSVAIITVNSDFKIVYKPKNLQIVKAYRALVERANEESYVLDMKLAPSIIKENYAFEQFMDTMPCTTEDEVQKYYQRFGQTLGLMYMLHGNDLHMENVIAAGEHPYVVDLETIFQTLISYDYPHSAELESRYKMQHWVNSTLLLPEKIIHNERGDVIEVSALSGQAQALTKKGYRLANNFTDEVRYELATLQLGGSNNLTMLNDQVVDYKQYIDFMIIGFENMLSFFKQNKQEITRSDGLLDQFRNSTIRLIIRNTHVYAEFLNNLYHPDCMRDYYYMEQALENLWVLPLQHKSLIATEYNDMLRGDIPIYFTKTDSHSVFDSDMNEFEHILAQTGFDQVKSKIESLSDEDIKRQITIIRVKTETVQDSKEDRLPSTYESQQNDHEEARIQFLEEAIAIGESLAASAVICEKSKTMSWLTVKDDELSSWNIGPVGGELYEGLSGITLFYHYLYTVTSKREFKTYRDYCFNMAMKTAPHAKYNSGLTGYASLVYPALKVLQSGPGKKYKQAIQEVMEYIKKAVDTKGVDWLNGKTSVIEMLLLIYEEQKDEEYLDIACQYGDRIIQEYRDDPTICSLGGLSHGYSGLAVSFLRLGKYTQHTSYSDFGAHMLQLDQELYDKQQQGWIDKRDQELKVRHFWCHGTVGIGLSRLKLYRQLEEHVAIAEDIRKVEQTISTVKLLKDDGLCHGNMGMVDLCLEMYKMNGQSDQYDRAVQIGASILADKRSRGAYYVNQFDGFLPIGLFKGLSGIGYEYLRLYDPQRVPSVLSLN